MSQPAISENLYYYKNIAVVVLNYLSIHETIDFLDSINSLFPGIRVIIVDNGSPSCLIDTLTDHAHVFPNVRLERLPHNVGFAKGMNHGINTARQEGYNFVAVSNNDVLFDNPQLFSSMLQAEAKTGCAAVGPQILTPSGLQQNPVLFSRPSNKKANRILLSTSYIGIARSLFFNLMRSFFPNRIIQIFSSFRNPICKDTTKENNNFHDGYIKVYALHGAFILLCPAFFNHYNGFFDGTFLYGEELFLGEMLYRKNLISIFNNEVSIFHKEDKTSTLLWGGQNKLKPLLYARRSIILWHNYFFSPRG